MLKRLFVLEWKSFTRSADFGKGLAVRILMGFIALYLLVSVLSLGIALHYMLVTALPQQEPMVWVNRSLLAWFGLTFLIRMMFQKLPVMNVKPLLIQYVPRSTLTHYTLLKSSYSFYNWLSLVLFVPFVIVTKQETAWNYSALIPWLLAILALDMAINYLTLYMQSVGAGSIRKVWPILIGLSALAAWDYFGGFVVSGWFGQYFQWVLTVPIGVLPILIASGLAYVLLYRGIRHKLYLDAFLQDRREQVRAFDLSWTSRFGHLAPFLQLDLNLLWRTRRARSVLLVSLLFLLYGLLLYPFGEIHQTRNVFVGVFTTGIFLINYGQFIPSWDGSYYSLLMTLPMSIARYLESKAFLMYLSIALMFILSTPYLYFGWEVIAINAACAVYNMGVNVPVILYFGSWNRKRVDLNNGNYFNYQGTGAAQWLVSLPLLIGPLLCWGLADMIGGFYSAIALLTILGTLGLIMRRPMLRHLAARYHDKRYEFLTAFHQID